MYRKSRQSKAIRAKKKNDNTFSESDLASTDHCTMLSERAVLTCKTHSFVCVLAEPSTSQPCHLPASPAHHTPKQVFCFQPASLFPLCPCCTCISSISPPLRLYLFTIPYLWNLHCQKRIKSQCCSLLIFATPPTSQPLLAKNTTTKSSQTRL